NPNLEKYQLALVYISSVAQTIHAWAGGEQFFDHIGGQSLLGFKNGNDRYTINEIGGTGKKILSAGAYTSKNRYVNLRGEERTLDASVFTQVGDLAPFSSRGPTLDGRIKPDVVAPGSIVASAVNSFGPIDSSVTTYRHAEGWSYSAFWGTSMAAPHLTGTIALLLEALPNIDPDTIKHLLQTTAVQDGFTGAIVGGSPDWGWGKLNAWRLLRARMGVADTVPNDTTPSDTIPDDTLARSGSVARLVRFHPNPVRGTLSITAPPDVHGTIRMRWRDARGICVREDAIAGAGRLNVENLTPGIYLVEISAGKRFDFVKIVIER
ncbi:MAG: S8 family serine peptidase, partial [Bacteroidia bacterium]|nr:S8 family peptidase [Bacteroidia bacterium]MDW8335167.1 S8 family serine peptidase [Bacteroidia bacterium]